MIYFIEAENGPIKIGFTKNSNVEQRLAVIQSQCPVKLKLLTAIPGSREKEIAFHETFEPHRMHGEWFKLSRKDIFNALEKGLPLGGQPPDESVATQEKTLDATENFARLKKRYGTHQKVALLLGVTARHYYRLRNGKCRMSKALTFLMQELLK